MDIERVEGMGFSRYIVVCFLLGLVHTGNGIGSGVGVVSVRDPRFHCE